MLAQAEYELRLFRNEFNHFDELRKPLIIVLLKTHSYCMNECRA